jgi:hypothetical protein
MTLAAKVAARYTQTNLEKTARSVLSYAIPDALGNTDLDKHLTSVEVPSEPRGRFSDGYEIAPRSGSLGYAFTIHYPTKAVTTFSFEVDLQPAELEHSIRMEQEVLKGIDIADMFKAVTATSALREPSDIIRTAIEEKTEVQQSTEAYSHDGPVKIAEYPAVYLRWDVQPAKQELKTQGSGFRHKTVLKVEWSIKPDGWAFESDLRRRPNGWNRLRL